MEEGENVTAFGIRYRRELKRRHEKSPGRNSILDWHAKFIEQKKKIPIDYSLE